MSVYDNLILSEPGLVSYWALDETSGTTTVDSAGTNPGTYHGSPTLGEAGISGTAVTLNGSSQYATVPDSASLHLPTTFTLEAWIKTTVNNTSIVVVAKYAPTTSVGYGLALFSGLVGIWVGDTSGGWFKGTRNVADGAWHHVVVTLSGTSVRVFVDGTLDAAGTRTPNLSTTVALQIGTDPTNPGTASFGGTVDAVAAYNVALGGDTIGSHYALGLGGTFQPVSGSRRPGGLGRALGVTFAAVTDGGILPYNAVTGLGPSGAVVGTLPTAAGASPWGPAGYQCSGVQPNLTFHGRGFATMPPGGLTLFACFRPSNVSATDQRIIKTSSDLGVGFGPRSSALQVINEGSGWYGLQSGLANGTWYAVAITINPGWGINSWLMNMQTRSISWTIYSAAGASYAAGDGAATLEGQAQSAVPLAGMANRAWTEAEARTFLADPFALVRPGSLKARTPFIVASSRGYPVSMLEHL